MSIHYGHSFTIYKRALIFYQLLTHIIEPKPKTCCHLKPHKLLCLLLFSACSESVGRIAAQLWRCNKMKQRFVLKFRMRTKFKCWGKMTPIKYWHINERVAKMMNMFAIGFSNCLWTESLEIQIVTLNLHVWLILWDSCGFPIETKTIGRLWNWNCCGIVAKSHCN